MWKERYGCVKGKRERRGRKGRMVSAEMAMAVCALDERAVNL